MDILAITIYIYCYNAIDSTFLVVRALYNFKSSLNNIVYEYYTTTTIVNRSKSIGVTRSISKRYYRYKEEQSGVSWGEKELYSNNEGREEPFYLALGARAREGEYCIIKNA